MRFGDFVRQFFLELKTESHLAEFEPLFKQYHSELLSIYKHECAFITNTACATQQETECRDMIAQAELDARHSLSLVHRIYKHKTERNDSVIQEENVRQKIVEQEEKARTRFANPEKKLVKSDFIHQSFPSSKKDSVSLEDWDVVSEVETGSNETLPKGFSC